MPAGNPESSASTLSRRGRPETIFEEPVV